MAGMLAAAALAPHVDRITVVERDRLPDTAVPRKGVPQGNQAHILLDRGRQAISTLLPNLFDQLEHHGAQRVDMGHEFWWYHGDHWKVRCDIPYTLWSQTRPFLEHYVREQLLRLPNVEFRMPAEVREAQLEEDRVVSVTLHDRTDDTTETIGCDLLVDAAGRGSHATEWLAAWGYGEPTTMSTRLDLGYATRLYRRPPGASKEWLCRIIYGKRPTHHRHGSVFTVENDAWLFTFMGYGGEHPPGDPEGLEQFARGLTRPELYELMRTAKPLSEIRQYKFPRQRWNRFDRMARLPGGYTVVGDALCSFDPVFGQGITVAAIEAEQLGEHVKARGAFDSHVFARSCARLIKEPWMLASIEAFRYPGAEGDRPPGLPMLHRILDRVFQRCGTDPVVYRAFLEVMQMQRGPASMMKPQVLYRLLRGGRADAEAEQPLQM